MAKIAIWEQDKTTPLKVIETEDPENENGKERKALETELMLSTLEKPQPYNNRFA